MLTRLFAFSLLLGSSSLALADKAPSPPPKNQAAQEVTLTGEIGCAHCSFKTAGVTECADAIRVKSGGKETTYLFAEGSSSKHDDAMCKQVRQGSATGTVSEKDGKKYIKVTKLDVKK